MNRLASLLRIPLWLERAWLDTRVSPPGSLPPPKPGEAETVPLPLFGGLVERR